VEAATNMHLSICHVGRGGIRYGIDACEHWRPEHRLRANAVVAHRACSSSSRLPRNRGRQTKVYVADRGRQFDCDL
jgi:hypothetical protein